MSPKSLILWEYAKKIKNMHKYVLIYTEALIKNCKNYLSTIHGFVDDFKYEVGPNDMEHQEDRKETVENVVGRKHGNNLRSFDSCAVQYPSGVHP